MQTDIAQDEFLFFVFILSNLCKLILKLLIIIIIII